MKINEVTERSRVDEFWPAVAAGAALVARAGPRIVRHAKNMFKKAPDSAKKRGITKGDSRADINRKGSNEFDQLPMPAKLTNKLKVDGKLGNTRKWKKDSNLDLQSGAYEKALQQAVPKGKVAFRRL
jgi:hypothetical protein